MPNAKLPLQSQVVFQVWWSTSIIQKLLEAYSSFPTFFHHLVPVFCIQVAAFRHFIQQFDLLHRKILAVPFFPNFSEVVVHLIFYHTTCHHLLTDLHLWSTPHLSKVRLSQTSGENSKDSPIWNKETSSHFGKHVEIGLESRWGSWEFAFHPSRPSALCSVSSSQIASSPGEKFIKIFAFFWADHPQIISNQAKVWKISYCSQNHHNSQYLPNSDPPTVTTALASKYFTSVELVQVTAIGAWCLVSVRRDDFMNFSEYSFGKR